MTEGQNQGVMMTTNGLPGLDSNVSGMVKCASCLKLFYMMKCKTAMLVKTFVSSILKGEYT